MRLGLDELDEFENDEDLQGADIIEGMDSNGNVKLGSQQPIQTLRDLEASHFQDRAFQNFRVKLNDFLNILLPTSGIPLPGGKHIHLTPDNEVIGFFLNLNHNCH
jgi:hypothetical protein